MAVESALVFGLRQADGRAAGFPLATLLEKLDAFETLEDGTLATDGSTGFEAVVFGHRGIVVKR
jgi:hypothetical protein